MRSMTDGKAPTQQKHSRRTRMPLVFICSPYRGDTQTNEQHARTYCSLAVSQGCIPFAPHLLFTQFLDDSKASERRKGMLMGAEMLKLCDELWVFGEPSTDMQAEIDLAKHMGIPVRWKLERKRRKPNEHLIPANRQQEAADQCDIGMKLWKGEAE